MSNNIVLPYKIKRKYPYLTVYIIIAFIMLIFALVCLFAPFIPTFGAFTPLMKRTYMIIGAVCTPFFAFVICYSILNLVSPAVGFTITEKGFTDHTMADGGVGFIPAEAIISLKLFGDKKKQTKQFLGIRLNTSDSDTFGKTKRARQEIRDNIESGMPAIIIRQCDLKISVRELIQIMMEVYGQKEVNEQQKPEKSSNELVNVPTITEEEAIAMQEHDSSNQDLDEVLEILPEDDTDEPIYENAFSMDDVPLTMEFENDKPRITNIDDLLSHIFEKKDSNITSNEK